MEVVSSKLKKRANSDSPPTTKSINISSKMNNINPHKKISKRIDNDNKQYISIFFMFLIEMFKIFMACFLTISVVQDCNGEVCTYTQLIQRSSVLELLTIGVNILNIIGFIILYGFELKREVFLIKYLDINKKKGDYNLVNVIIDYEYIKKNLKINNIQYYYCTLLLITITVLNWTVSCLMIFTNFHSMKTVTTLLTNMLLVTTKIYNCFNVSRQSIIKSLGLSAYMQENISFNVIDSDYVN